MSNNSNIFCVSNPAKMMDGLWKILSESKVPLENILIFLPSRRSVRTAEKMIVDKIGHPVILPRMIALGEGIPGEASDEDDDVCGDVVTNLERVVALSYLLSGYRDFGTISAALPVAHSLITMQDYLANSGVDVADIDWTQLVDEKYAHHFRDKAEMFGMMGRLQKDIFPGRLTETEYRNAGVLGWADYVKKLSADSSLVVVCGSTASVPVTRKLMTVIAGLPYGKIILPGYIDGEVEDFVLDTNPYNSEYAFLQEIGCVPSDVRVIDVGESHINFMNRALGNSATINLKYDLKNCHLIETDNEADEAAAVAQIASDSVAVGKSVLIITPDAAGNQRLNSEFAKFGINADFSGGRSGTTVAIGRAILNLFDDWLDEKSDVFEKIYAENKTNLFDTVADIVVRFEESFAPKFVMDESESIQVLTQIKKLSDYLVNMKIVLNLSDARAMIADALSSVRIRQPMDDTANVVVLGTIESRMQTADVVILTGLNEGMFPAFGYENPWLPRRIAESVGVPSGNHKVSLMALDFMNLSCGKDVYWLRSKNSGGVQTQESRFLSRVIVARGVVDTTCGNNVLDKIKQRDDVMFVGLDYSAPVLQPDWSDVYVTELDWLLHNPYDFYIRHILRLRKKKDFWVGVDARDFGNLVHSVLEHADSDISSDKLISELDSAANEKIGRNSLLFHFWHKRFVEIAPVALKMLDRTKNAKTEIQGFVKIAGRNVRARADRVWSDGVLDIKTGEAPGATKLLAGTAPQLPLEAEMLKTGGFQLHPHTDMPTIMFLQLKSGATELIEYSVSDTQEMINAACNKVTELFNMYSAGGADYEYRTENDARYHECDDFARATERD